MAMGLENMNRLVEEATEFFDRFVAAFHTFDGEVVARLFSHPYLAVDQHGNQSVLECIKDTASHFQNYLDEYKTIGSDSCSYENLAVLPIGKMGALASVTWILRNAEGDETSSWRESYCVLRKSGQMKAYATVDHAA